MTGQDRAATQRRVSGGRGAVLTLLDQLVSSASNFILGVLVARAGGAGALDAFGIAFLIWLPGSRACSCRTTGVGWPSELQRADHALVNDLVFAAVQGSIAFALFAVGVESALVFIASWGIGATAVAGPLLAGVHLRPTGRGGIAHLRALWPRRRWFLRSFVLSGATYPVGVVIAYRRDLLARLAVHDIVRSLDSRVAVFPGLRRSRIGSIGWPWDQDRDVQSFLQTSTRLASLLSPTVACGGR